MCGTTFSIAPGRDPARQGRMLRLARDWLETLPRQPTRKL
jgi:hypothetical protein